MLWGRYVQIYRYSEKSSRVFFFSIMCSDTNFYLELLSIISVIIISSKTSSYILSFFAARLGHSGQIGNTPNLAGKKSKSMLQLFPMHNWCWFEFLKMKKAKGKLKTDYRVFSPPYFEIPVSRNDEGFLEVISSPRLWFQVSCKYLNSYSYPSNIVIMFCFNFKLQMPKMRKKWKKLDW